MGMASHEENSHYYADGEPFYGATLAMAADAAEEIMIAKGLLSENAGGVFNDRQQDAYDQLIDEFMGKAAINNLDELSQ
jgi:hypothetical protein